MEKKRIIIVGAGIVGVAVAIHLQRRGFSVSLIDRALPGKDTAASFGNAGVISPSALVPVQYPGMLWQIPSLLRDSDGPLSLDFLHIIRHAGWFASYLRHGRVAEVRRIAAALAGLTHDALAEHLTLAGNSTAAAWIKESDYLYIYQNRSEFISEKFSFALRAKHGICWHEVDAAELRQLEPDLSTDFQFAIRLPKHGIALNPGRLVYELAQSFTAAGGDIIHDEVRHLNPHKRKLSLSSSSLTFDSLIIAAGAQSAALAQQAGVHAPLVGERGYHVSFHAPQIRHHHALKVSAGKYVATPMDGGTRIAGIVEFKSPHAPLDKRIIARLRRHAQRLFPTAKLDDASEWLGFRPALPDSLPIIGRAPAHPNIYLAFGHHHIGLTTGAKTGKLIAQLIAGEKPEIDLSPFSPARFAGGKAS